MSFPGLSSRRGRLLIVFLLPLAVYLFCFAVARPVPTGDEPHYLIFATSLAKDHDIDLRNNYANSAQSRSVYPPGHLSPAEHAFTYRSHGPLVSMHAIGLPLLLAPIIALGGKFTAARMLMCLLAAAVGPFLLAILDVLEPRHLIWNLLAGLAVMLCVPTLAYSGLIYPEVPGTLLVTISLWSIVAAPPTRGLLVTGAFAAALLPWLHDRYVILTVPLVLAVMWRTFSSHRTTAAAATSSDPDGQEPKGPRHSSRSRHRRPAVIAVASVTALPLLSAVGLVAYQVYAYGSLSPNAPYRLSQYQDLKFHPSLLYYNTLGSLLGPVAGPIPYAPVLLLALAGMMVFVHRWRWAGLLVLLVAAGYFAFVTDLVSSGAFGPPGRFAVILMPVLAMTLAAILGPGRLVRGLFGLTLAYSLLLSGISIAKFSVLYPSGVDQVGLPVAQKLSRMWPDFPLQLHDGFQMTASQALRHTGVIQPSAGDPGGVAVAAPGDPMEALVYGPYASVLPGTYRADFPIRASAAPPGTKIGDLRILQRNALIASRPIVVEAAGDGVKTMSVFFSTTGQSLQTVVFYDGVGAIEVGTIKVAPAAPGSAPFLPHSGDGLVLAWIVVIGLLGVLGLSEATAGRDALTGPTAAPAEHDTAAPPRHPGEPQPAGTAQAAATLAGPKPAPVRTYQ